jgi:voltage-gated potassium channel
MTREKLNEGSRSDSALSQQAMRRAATRTLALSFVVGIAIVVAYFTLPLTPPLVSRAAGFLAASLIALGALMWWHLRSVVNSPVPRVRSIAALLTTLPLFLVVFASVYFVLSDSDAANFSESLSRLDALYFTVTVFATVGFGDITPGTEIARATTLIQMAADLVLVGLLVRALVGAARVGVARRDSRRAGTDGPGTDPSPGGTDQL